MTDATVLVTALFASFLGKRKSAMLNFGFLWACNVLAQPVRAASKIVTMAGNQRKQLQFRGFGKYLEQPCTVGRDGRQR